MTPFGVRSSFTSPAAKRIWEAGERFLRDNPPPPEPTPLPEPAAEPEPIDASSYANAVEAIAATVARHFGIALSDLFGRSHRPDFARPRHVAMLLARELTDLSLGKLGCEMSYRNQATIAEGIETARLRIAADQQLAAEVQTLRERLEEALP